MCFFNSMTGSAEQIARRYLRRFDAVEAWKQIMAEREPSHIQNLKELYRYRLAEGMYNVPAYEEPHCIIVSDSDQLQIMDWGLIPRYTKPDKREFYNKKNWHKNARAEEIFDKWPWKFLIRSRRCIIPSTGYFEYHYGPDKKTRPYFIHLTDREVFSMGGLWDEWVDPATGEKLRTFVQITTQANSFTRRINNGGAKPFRMPFILKPEDEQRWLDPGLSDAEIASLLKPYPAEGMTAYPVDKQFKDMDPFSKRVIREDEQDGQSTLDL
ncbi:MAG: SOS response-associated peptidase [Rikenellaceae bacterium]|nr:SOS response-associated peptidase [Rikenellaceae bacterium]